jgi:hypothetical protein
VCIVSQVQSGRPEAVALERTAAVRHAFSLCVVTKYLNEALHDWRRAVCTDVEYADGLMLTLWQNSDLKAKDWAALDKWTDLGLV